MSVSFGSTKGRDLLLMVGEGNINVDRKCLLYESYRQG